VVTTHTAEEQAAAIEVGTVLAREIMRRLF